MKHGPLKKVFFYLISFLLTILLIETGLQVINGVVTKFWKKPETNPLQLYYQDKKMADQIWNETHNAIKDRDYTQFLGWADRNFHGLYVNEDQQSGRKNWNPEPSPGRPLEKIFFLGGSSGWGFGVGDNFTIPSYLSKMLNTPQAQFQVLNYSVPGYIVMQGIIHLELLLKEGQSPRYVIFYDGFNEIFAAHQHGIAGTVHNLFMDRERLRRENLRYRDLVWNGAKEAIRKYSMIYKAINSLHLSINKEARFREEVAQSYNDKQLRSLAQNIVEDYKKSINLLDHLSRAYGFKYICFWQPSMFTEKKLFDKESNIDPWLENEAFKKLYIYTNEYLQKENIPHFYILTDVLEKRPQPVYIDVAHITEQGNQVVAGVIFKYLEKEFYLTNAGNNASKINQ
ncbi:MAG: hypothetical protein ACYDIC_11085 [Desulfobaccales bacterium]